MGADEEGTHERLKAHLRDLIEPKIAEHWGRAVKNTGDGFLAEFASVVDAVRCAVEVQHGMAERNAGIAEDNRIAFRIGLNLGDIIVEGGDFHGDGVNIAGRLEGVAEPGGICISEDAYRQVRGKVDAEFVDMGEQRLKTSPGRCASTASIRDRRLNPLRPPYRSTTSPQSPSCPSPT